MLSSQSGPAFYWRHHWSSRGCCALAAGVCTATLKLPGPGIIDDLIVTVAWELLSTEVASVVPLKTTSEDETNWLPVAVRTKLRRQL